MRNRILITGGAGFIGSHLADELLSAGNTVKVLDGLSAQVHGTGNPRPTYLSSEVELVKGDIRDPDTVSRALEGIDAVVHLAASVGVGQSMYRIADYVGTNELGTAVLLEKLISHPVERLVVASSMSVYGEGLYRDSSGTLYPLVVRSLERLRQGDWELRNEQGELLEPVPTPETKVPSLSSIYALTKYQQEQSCLIIGGAYGIPTVALRFFNVYGPRQALSNPYTGVLAIFAARLLNGNPPCIYEDGEQKRDFVSVHDVARACCLALESADAGGQVLNIGSGRAYSISQIAEQLARVLGKENITADKTGQFRVGDIRHCFGDISRARDVLKYEPCVDLESGIKELAEWLASQSAVDRFGEANAELAARGLAGVLTRSPNAATI